MATKLEGKELERIKTDFDAPAIAPSDPPAEEIGRLKRKQPATAETLLRDHTPKTIREAIEEIEVRPVPPAGVLYVVKLRDGWTGADGEREINVSTVRQYEKAITAKKIRNSSNAAPARKTERRPLGGGAHVQALAVEAVKVIEASEAEAAELPAGDDARRQGRPHKRDEETKMMTMRLPRSLWRKLKIIAALREQSCADVVIDLLERLDDPELRR